MSDETKKDPEANRTVAGSGTAGTAGTAGTTGAGGDASGDMPKAKELSFAQKAGIWVLIVIVGALFGMSGSLSILQEGDRTISGISEREIEVRFQIAKRLQSILPEQFMASFEEYAQMLKIARAAEEEGLMPAGHALDVAVDEFLAKKLPDRTRTYKDALVENIGGKNEVSRVELKRFLAERIAVQAFRLRHVYAPAVPVGAADDLTSVYAPKIGQDPTNWQAMMTFPQTSADQVLVDEVVLQGTAQLPTIADDDADLQVTYERLRGERFTRPEAVTATIAHADLAKILAATQIADADAQAYFDNHPDEFAKQPAPDAKPDAKPETKPFAEVKAEIVEKLRKEAADKAARKQLEAFDQVVDAQGLDGQKDNTAFKQAALDAGLMIKDNVLIESPASARPSEGGQGGVRELVIADLGTLKDQVGLFNRDKDLGFTTRALKTSGTTATWLVLRIDGRRDAGFKELSEVKTEIVEYLRGQRAYKPFMEQAESARAAAEKLGPNGLTAYLATPEGSKWNAQVTPAPMAPAHVLRVPAKDIGQLSSDSRVAGSLIVAEHPVALVEAEAVPGSEVPRAKLVQARGYQVGRPADPRMRTVQTRYYRSELENYRSSIFNQEYQRILEAK
ncbi:MAG: hypothetical protein H0V44_05595 [Planctomycetes bacterium]|nr:hypothetical protein [Planctomycetota bacterium]